MQPVEEYIYGLLSPGQTLRCPFHDDQLASSVVMHDSGNFYCFRCHIGGNQTEIARRYYFNDMPYGIGMSMARALLKDRPTIKPDVQTSAPVDHRVGTLLTRWQQFCNKALDAKPALIQQLQQTRGIQNPVALGIGYSDEEIFNEFLKTIGRDFSNSDLLIQSGLISRNSEDRVLTKRFRLYNRWILPEIRNNQTLYYNARAAYDTVIRYLNPPLPRVLFGWETLKRPTDRIWLVEGAFDLYPLAEAGESVISTSGIGMSQKRLQEIVDVAEGRLIIIAYDNDPPKNDGISPGIATGAMRVQQIVNMGGNATQIVPKAKDMGEWIVAEGVHRVIAQATWNI